MIEGSSPLKTCEKILQRINKTVAEIAQFNEQFILTRNKKRGCSPKFVVKICVRR